MRPAICVVIVLFFAWLSVAQEKKAATKPAPTAEDVIGLVGGRMASVFAKLGVPATVDGGDPGQVWLEYDGFSVLIEKGDKAFACAFWPNWKQSVNGIKLSESQEEMIQKLGNPRIAKKNADGMAELSWGFTDQKKEMVARFRNEKCSRLFIYIWGGADAIK